MENNSSNNNTNNKSKTEQAMKLVIQKWLFIALKYLFIIAVVVSFFVIINYHISFIIQNFNFYKEYYTTPNLILDFKTYHLDHIIKEILLLLYCLVVLFHLLFMKAKKITSYFIFAFFALYIPNILAEIISFFTHFNILNLLEDGLFALPAIIMCLIYNFILIFFDNKISKLSNKIISSENNV